MWCHHTQPSGKLAVLISVCVWNCYHRHTEYILPYAHLPLYARYHHSHTLFCQQMRIADIFPLACSNTDLMWLTQNWVYIWPEETATDDRLHYMISQQGRYRIPWIACTHFMKLQSKFSCRDNIAILFMFTKSAGYRLVYFRFCSLFRLTT